MVDFLDFPAPVFAAVDGLMAKVLPPALRLALWALFAAIVTMELYRLLSPQARIFELKLRFAEKKQALDSFDGEFEDAWPMMRSMLGAAFMRVAIVLPGTLVAALPLLLLLVWIDRVYRAENVLPFGPGWVRGWEFSFIAAMIACSLLYKHVRRIQ
jgi:hypothetical protein